MRREAWQGKPVCKRRGVGGRRGVGARLQRRRGGGGWGAGLLAPAQLVLGEVRRLVVLLEDEDLKPRHRGGLLARREREQALQRAERRVVGAVLAQAEFDEVAPRLRGLEDLGERLHAWPGAARVG